MIYPDFPAKGEYIGICAPSAGVGHKIDSFDRSLETIEECGFNTVETASVRNDDIRSADADVRGNEFNQLVWERDIKMIIAASGGDYNLEVLPYIDWGGIYDNPKWVAGASDPTNILFPLTTKLDIATMYGFNAGTFDWEELHEFQENALRIISGDIVEQHSFDMYDCTGYDSPEPEFQPVYWDMLIPGVGFNEPDYELEVSGRLIGGCIDCISKLIGTPFDGTKDFIERYAEEGIIWYFDPFAMTADDLYTTMLQMTYAGYFEGTRAIVIGRVCFPGDSDTLDYAERFSRICDVPVIFNADIGHVKPAMTMINGSYATVRCKDGRGTISMELI